jgi:hypothetical protein
LVEADIGLGRHWSRQTLVEADIGQGRHWSRQTLVCKSVDNRTFLKTNISKNLRVECLILEEKIVLLQESPL